MLDELRPGTSNQVLAVSSVLMNQWHVVIKVSLNRNAHRISLCIDC